MARADYTKPADGYLAVEAWRDDFFGGGAQQLRVWSAATGEWATRPKLPNGALEHVIGRMK